MTTPSFWDPNKVSEWYFPNLEAAREEGRKAGLRPASDQTKRGEGTLFIGVDYEWDFSDDGRLPVKGTFDDVRRLCERIIKGTLEGVYTGFIFTIDAHPTHVIHGNTWWQDEQGNPPDVSIPLQMRLVDPLARVFEGLYPDGSPVNKNFRPAIMRDHTVKYAQHLGSTGQGNIWVFTSHCRLGTDGICLIPALAEVVEWASAARRIQPTYLWKGFIPEVDWFGPFRPCMDVPTHPQGGLQTTYLDQIKAAKRTEITGEAEDFCVHWGMVQVLEYYGTQSDVLKKVHFIENCTSPIVSGPHLVQFKQEMQSKGVQIIRYDSPFR